LVLLECGNASSRRPYRARVNVLRKALAQEQRLIDPTPKSRRAGTSKYPYMRVFRGYCPLYCYFKGLADDPYWDGIMEQIHRDRKSMSS
jgi:hypothetical protein